MSCLTLLPVSSFSANGAEKRQSGSATGDSGHRAYNAARAPQLQI